MLGGVEKQLFAQFFEFSGEFLRHLRFIWSELDLEGAPAVKCLSSDTAQPLSEA